MTLPTPVHRNAHRVRLARLLLRTGSPLSRCSPTRPLGIWLARRAVRLLCAELKANGRTAEQFRRRLAEPIR